ncbi:hypothetical protein KAR29_05015 [Aminithiophilus ramosus]|uniref:Uncharacterized protein n=1 Tax=Aminithiophilus ramosus TaxID=3029084 RepID=A0A9Q7EZS3_9BACT|nr:hypothetical protein [Aminithiophilus ramosus]QTX33251.1 hypothetical protein KAR29_05015 [Aminithiophilus ramosus]
MALIRLGDQSRVGEKADAIIEAPSFDWSLYRQGDCEDRLIRSKSFPDET